MGCCDKKRNPWRLVLWLAVVFGVLTFVILYEAYGEVDSSSTPGHLDERVELNAFDNIYVASEQGDSHGDHAHGTDEAEGNHDESAGDSESAEHDHSSHGQAESEGFLARFIGWLGKFHPAATDFPIAMLIGGAMAEGLLILTGRSIFDSAARFMVWLGCASAVPAVALGWFYAGFRWADSSWVMTVHRWLGTGIGLWSMLLLLLCIAAHRDGGDGQRYRPWYRAALFIGAAVVGVNGFLGGALIYGLDHYNW